MDNSFGLIVCNNSFKYQVKISTKFIYVLLTLHFCNQYCNMKTYKHFFSPRKQRKSMSADENPIEMNNCMSRLICKQSRVLINQMKKPCEDIQDEKHKNYVHFFLHYASFS